MRPGLKIHGYILGLPALLGLALLLMEWGTTADPGGLFGKYTATRLFWIALAAYALCSSAVVMLAAGIAALRKRALSPATVALCHVIPVGLVLTMLYFGVHDTLQNLWSKPVQQLRPPARYQPMTKRSPHAPRTPSAG